MAVGTFWSDESTNFGPTKRSHLCPQRSWADRIPNTFSIHCGVCIFCCTCRRNPWAHYSSGPQSFWTDSPQLPRAGPNQEPADATAVILGVNDTYLTTHEHAPPGSGFPGLKIETLGTWHLRWPGKPRQHFRGNYSDVKRFTAGLILGR